MVLGQHAGDVEGVVRPDGLWHDGRGPPGDAASVAEGTAGVVGGDVYDAVAFQRVVPPVAGDGAGVARGVAVEWFPGGGLHRAWGDAAAPGGRARPGAVPPGGEEAVRLTAASGFPPPSQEAFWELVQRASDITRERVWTSRVFWFVNRRDVGRLSRVMSDGLHA